MQSRFGMSAVVAGGICLLASIASAQFPPITDPNAGEAKCEQGTGKALTKFIGTKAKCGAKCLALARKTSGPYGGCFSPYADATTQACIYGVLKGAKDKASATIGKSCTLDCPECYISQDPNICVNGGTLLTNADNQTNVFGPVVYCIENGGGTPTAAEAKCEDGVSKALVKFVGSKSKCYTKCNQNMLKGKIAPNSCTPPVPSDPATQLCIFDPLKGAEAKAAAAIDKVCGSVGANPACYGTGLDTGQEWANLTEGAVDASTPNVACGQ